MTASSAIRLIACFALIAGVSCVPSERAGPPQPPSPTAQAVTELFAAYEARDLGRFEKRVHARFRSLDSSGRSQFLEATATDFENLQPIQFQVVILDSIPLNDGVTRVQVRWRRRAQARVSGEEWITVDRLGVLLLREELLFGVEGDTPFGVSDATGAIAVSNGTIDSAAPAAGAQIRQGRFIP